MTKVDNGIRTGGILLLASLVPFAVFAFLAIRGNSPATYGLFRPVQDLAPRLPVRSWGLIWQLFNPILVLAGFGFIATGLQKDAGRTTALVGLALILVSVALNALEATFYQSMTPWAAQEAARTGAKPEIFTAMFDWMNRSLQIAYMIFGLLGYAAFGWSFLQSATLPSWIGWSTLLWSSFWLLFTVTAQTTLPVGVFLWPWVLGGMLVGQG